MKTLSPAEELLGTDADWQEWQSDNQVIWEIVDSESGDVVTRHWSPESAQKALDEMIHRDGCEPHEYFVRERGCSLAPLE